MQKALDIITVSTTFEEETAIIGRPNKICMTVFIVALQVEYWPEVIAGFDVRQPYNTEVSSASHKHFWTDSVKVNMDLNPTVWKI